MYFGKSLFTKRCLSLLVLMAMFSQTFYLPVSTAFSFFGLDESEAEETVSVEIPEVIVTPLVAVLVESDLYADLAMPVAIDRYAVDAANAIDGQSVLIPIPKDTSPKEIYEGLAQLYFLGEKGDGLSKLEGVVLIGEVPLPVVEKNARLWPTVFPYTDFENNVYHWDMEKDRFVFADSSRMDSEIWHGVIRSQKENFEHQKNDILGFLDQNTLIHSGTKVFSDKVFYADIEIQKLLPQTFKDQYAQWIKYAEEITYQRFSKDLYSKIDADLKDLDTSEDITEEFGGAEREKLLSAMMTSTGLSRAEVEAVINNTEVQIPDIQAKELIGSLSRDYASTATNWLNIVAELVDKTGAWTIDDTDTTVKFVTQKDQESINTLKLINDFLELSFYELLDENNIAEDISVSKIIRLPDPDDRYKLVENSTEKPLYWNGVARASMKADDCSLYRGSAVNATRPFAKKVLASQLLNPMTSGMCVSPNASDIERSEDVLGGCCFDNLSLNSDGEMNLSGCNTGSDWTYSASLLDWSHEGARTPIFDITATDEADGPDGASGCEEILVVDNEDPEISTRMDSLFFHIEPTEETLNAQANSLITEDLPVDDPRGFSFYDHQRKFNRVDFVNVFSLRDSFKSVEALELELTSLLTQKIKELNSITEKGNVVSENRYRQEKDLSWAGKQFELPSGSDLVGGCDYTKKESTIDSFTKKIMWTEKCAYASPVQPDGTSAGESIETENNVARFYETGRLIPLDQVKHLLANIDIDSLYASTDWLDKDIDKKEQVILTTMLGGFKAYQSFFDDSSFQGYELAHLTTEITDGSTLPVGLDGGYNQYDEEFHEAGANNVSFSLESDGAFSDELLGDSSIDLSDKVLAVEPKQIFVSKDSNKLSEVTFTLKDDSGEIDESNHTTEVTLDFSSTDINKFFTVLPDNKISVSGGKATFFLVPKESSFGGKFSFTGKVIGNRDLRTESVSIIVSRYNILAFPAKESVRVNEAEGVLLSVKVMDGDGNSTNKFEGKNLIFSTELGTFQGGISTAQIRGDSAEILFYPGRKSGNAMIEVLDETGELPFSTISLPLLPGEPHHLSLENTSRFLVEGNTYQPIEAQLLDLYGNSVLGVSHDLSWKIEDGEVENQQERDNNPRENGVQEWVTDSVSVLNIRPKKSAGKVRVSLESSVLPDDKGISKIFTVETDPKITATISRSSLLSGTNKPVTVFLTSKSQEGVFLPHNFNISISVTPAEFSDTPKTVEMKNGEGQFSFYPGTKAGIYTLIFSADGFEGTSLEFEIEADKAKKIQLNVDKNVWNKNIEKIPLDIVVIDQYGNRVISFNEKISLRLTKKTRGLFSIPNEELMVRKGKTTTGVIPQGKGGVAHFIVEGNNVIGDTLELTLVEDLKVTDIEGSLSPNVKFMILSGAAGGNLLLPKNVGSSLLFAGNLQSLVTLGVPYESVMHEYGSLGKTGAVTENLEMEFVFGQNRPEVLILSEGRIISKAKFFYASQPTLYKGDKIVDYGVYFKPNPTLESVDILGQDILLDEERLVSFTGKGGVDVLAGGISLTQNGDNIKKWILTKEDTIIGDIYFHLPDELFSSADSEIENNFLGITLKVIDPQIDLKSVYTGNSTTGEKGISMEDKEIEASTDQKLGSNRMSIESTQQFPQNVWTSDWKPASLFAAGNNVGDSVMNGASDALILLGDPTLKRGESTQVEGDKTMGELLWHSPSGNIDNIFVGDINGDEKTDLFALVEDKLMLLYQKDAGIGDFVDMGPLLVLDGGVQSFAALNIQNVKLGFIDFVQINASGDFIWHKNTQGTFTSQKVPFGQKFTEIKSANLNGDTYPDIVGVDKNKKLWTIFGTSNGFGSPELMENLSPVFTSISEGKDGDEDQSLTSDIRISYDGIKDEVDTSDISEKDFSYISRTNSRGRTDEILFLPLPETIITSTLGVDSNGRTISIGSSFKGQLTLESPTNIKNVMLILPLYENLEFDTESLKCVGCEKTPKAEVNDNLGGVGISNINLSAKSKLILTWELKVEDLPPTEFFIGDTGEDKDTLDDISIPWSTGGGTRILEFDSMKNYRSNAFSRLVAALDMTSLTKGYSTIKDSAATIAKSKATMEKTISNVDKMGLNYDVPSGVTLTEADKATYNKALETLKTKTTDELTKQIKKEAVTGITENVTSLSKTSLPGVSSSVDSLSSAASKVQALQSANAGTLGTAVSGKLNLPTIDITPTLPEGMSMDNVASVLASSAKEEAGAVADSAVSKALDSAKNAVSGAVDSAKGLVTKGLSKLGGTALLKKLNALPENNLTKNIKASVDKLNTKKSSTLSATTSVGTTQPSVALLASGLIMKYNSKTSPYATPMGITPGKPIINTPYYRYYLVTTSTGKVVPAYCLGLKPPFMIPSVWMPNCKVIYSPTPAVSGGASSSGPKGTPTNVFSLTKKESPNTAIPPVDIVSKWMRDQMRYITYNIGRALPNTLFFAPDNRAFDVKKETLPLSVKEGVYENLKEVLAIYPYVNIHTTVVTEEVPNIDLFQTKNLTDEEQRTVDSYKKLKQNLLEQRAHNYRVLAEVATDAKLLAKYYVSWRKENDKKIKKWADRTQEMDALYKQIKAVSADFFARFDKTYRTNVADRGTWLPWLYESFIGANDAVIVFETYPDIMHDMSEVSMGIDVYLTDIIIKTVDITQADIKPYKEQPWPETVVHTKIEKLPILPNPPALPSTLFASIQERMAKPTMAAPLFGQLRLGTASVPEWGLKPYIEQLTNRSDLTQMLDWGQLDLHPLQTKKPQKEKKSTLSHEKVSYNNTRYFDMDYNLTRTNKHLDRLVLQLAQEKQKLVVQKAQDTSEFFVEAQQKSGRYFAANTEEETNSRKEKETEELFVSNSALYLKKSKDNTEERIVTQTLEANAISLFRDIDSDGQEEILYVDGSNLYLKYRNPKKERDEEDIPKVAPLKKWNINKFLAKLEVASSVTSSGSGLFFKPFGEVLPYYEWFLSDRPDVSFEMTKFPADRKSKIWKRYGLIRSDAFINYKISGVPMKITEVSGSPRIKTVKPQELMTYSYEKCINPDVTKLSFDSRTVFIAQEDDTRMEIRVPAIQFRPSDYQTLRLKKGEVTSIENGEVCVFSGRLEYVKLDEDPEWIEPQKGDMIAAKLSTEVEEGDFLQITLPDESLINIYERDDYRLDFFDPEILPISQLGVAVDEHPLYALLIGVLEGKRTLVRRKLFVPPNDNY